MHHIRERLPDIKARLNTLMGQTQQELASYGDMHFSGKEHRVNHSTVIPYRLLRLTFL